MLGRILRYPSVLRRPSDINTDHPWAEIGDVHPFAAEPGGRGLEQGWSLDRNHHSHTLMPALNGREALN